MANARMSSFTLISGIVLALVFNGALFVVESAVLPLVEEQNMKPATCNDALCTSACHQNGDSRGHCVDGCTESVDGDTFCFAYCDCPAVEMWPSVLNDQTNHKVVQCDTAKCMKYCRAGGNTNGSCDLNELAPGRTIAECNCADTE